MAPHVSAVANAAKLFDGTFGCSTTAATSTVAGRGPVSEPTPVICQVRITFCVPPYESNTCIDNSVAYAP